MTKNIAVIFEDGIGPEVTKQSLKLLDAIATWSHNLLGGEISLRQKDKIRDNRQLEYESTQNRGKLSSLTFQLGVQGDVEKNPRAVNRGMFVKLRPSRGKGCRG